MIPKIAILACWSGPYPWYFPYFIHSCSFNPTIDFYIVTDNKDELADFPSNVKRIYKTLKDFNTIASQKFGFPVCVDNPYKLNDYKPAYGFLFPEIVEGYDYWAHCDLDIVLGDLRAFFTNELLVQYEFFSVRHDYTAGCFCLYKNSRKVNTIFMRSKDYKLVMSDPKHHCFDECNFAWHALREGKSIMDIHTEIESFTEVVRAAQKNNVITAFFDFNLIEGKTGRIVFDHGKIVYKNRFEAVLYHLYCLKQVYSPMKAPKKIPDKYYFSPTRIYH